MRGAPRAGEPCTLCRFDLIEYQLLDALTMKGRHFPAPACNLTLKKDAQRVFCQPLIFQLVP